MRRHMSKGIRLGLVVLLAVASVGCAHRVVHHRPHKTVVALDREHHSHKVVIVHKAPAPKRHCTKHRGHWHCRR